MKIAVANSRKEKNWINKDMTLDDFKSRCKNSIRTTETVAEYKKASKSKQDDIKDVGGFVCGELKNGERRKGSINLRSALTLDMDFATPDAWNIILKQDFNCFIYSTHKHTKAEPRLRLVIPLSREVTEDEYEPLGRMVAKDIGIDMFDDTTYQAERLMYWPSTSSDGNFVFKENNAKFINPDDYLNRYKDWKDVTTWPVSSRQSIIIKTNLSKQEDPLLKKGVIGAFCRAYSMEEVIATFLNDVYDPTTVEGRYTYKLGKSSCGLVIYDDKFAYSHHSTDPVQGLLLNAFDIVRIHKFGSLDNKAAIGTSVGKLPSFKKMTDFAINDDLVKEQLAIERKEAAEADFIDENWEKYLELEKSGVIKSNLNNLILILQHDPNLKGIVYNELSDSLQIVGDVPWENPNKFWRDADDAQLVSYIEKRYGTFSKRHYDIALTKVADDRSFHPIKEFVEALPSWDGAERVDSLLIDYLGAVDNEYVRAVTRKTLCAAFKRILKPGCKFDSMLVLNGPQGIGKSTLIKKLGGEWFSDSLNLSDTKDKTAAEKLQGYWILEIGELAGLRKAEVETLRSFLSRQNDIFRAAFGRRTIPHLRQCIFFGTTNAEKGYLRDVTGNRRFWPVKTPGDGNKKSWDLTKEEINQIWAEVLHYVNEGEALYLENEMEELAKVEQREAMESDEKEGLVKDFLDMLLPKDWEEMSTLERRNFINGSDFGPSQKEGTKERSYVSNMEIWCECYGKNRADIRKVDSNEISQIIASIGGWRRCEKKIRISNYGPQWIYVPVKKS